MPFILKLLAVGLFLHGYVGLRLMPALALSPGWQLAGCLVLALSFVLICSAFLRQRTAQGTWADILSWAGFIALGTFSFLLVGTFIRDAGLGLVWLLQGFDTLSAGVLRGSAWAVLILTLLASLAAVFNARRLARVKTLEIALSGLPAALDGLTIVQLSDIHVGPTIKRGYVQGIVDAANALQPDIIALTGDLVDGQTDVLAPHVAPLAGLRARDGVFMVTGNHEYYSGADAWVAAFRGLGMTVLMNQHVLIRREAALLALAGVTDYSGGAFDPAHLSDPAAAAKGIPEEAARILLAHQPRSAAAAERAGFRLQLSGHTHGGQFVPWNLFVPMQQPFVAGLKRVGELQVYISRGTGYWGPPMRLGAPSEITRIRLRTA